LNYLLDSNACIAIMKGTPPGVRHRFDVALVTGAEIFASTVVAFELWYGVEKSARRESNAGAVQAFFRGCVHLLALDQRDAEVSGKIRCQLEAAGKPLGAYDYLIAGQALAREMTLVTSNVREFSRVRGLAWEDWAKA